MTLLVDQPEQRAEPWMWWAWPGVRTKPSGDKPPYERPDASVGPNPFCARLAVMRTNGGAVDHVGWAITTCQLHQDLQKRIDHAELDPASVAAEHAIPVPVFRRQMAQPRACTGHPSCRRGTGGCHPRAGTVVPVQEGAVV